VNKTISILDVEGAAIEASIALQLGRKDGTIEELADIFYGLATIPERESEKAKKSIIVLGEHNRPIINFLEEVIQRYYNISAWKLNYESISLRTKEIADELKNQEKFTKQRKNYLSQFSMEVSRIANKYNGLPRAHGCSHFAA